MKAKWVMLIINLGLCLLLTSCWNSRELDELAIVSGVGIDKVPDKDEYRVTFQIVNPSAIATSVGANTGQTPMITYSARDSTLFGALRKASRQSSRQLFFAHTQLLVIGEPLAKSGINEIFDVFERSHEFRLMTNVLVSRGTDAASVLKILSPVENLSAVSMVKKTKNSTRVWGESRDINVFEIIKGITGEGEVIISGIRIMGDPEEGMKKTNLEQTEVKTLITMSELAVFKDGKLKYWMDGPQSRGTLWVQNKLEETSINIDSYDKKEAVAVNILLSKTQIKVDVVDGVPVFRVYIREEGSINETKEFFDLSKGEEIKKLQVGLAKKTKDDVMQSLKVAQSMKCDIFNFGNELKRTNPKVWETVKEDWDNLFAKGELDVRVEAYIRSTGMTSQPYKSNPE